MTPEDAERLEELVNIADYKVRYTGGPYVNLPGCVYTNDDDAICYKDNVYAEMILVNVPRTSFSVFKPIPNWWESKS